MTMTIRRELPLILATLTALVMIASFFLNIPPLNQLAAESQRLMVPIGSAARLVGGITLLIHHVLRIQRRRGKWALNALFVGVFFFFLILYMIPGLGEVYNTLYVTIVGRTTEAMWGIIALFMVSMAYRAFAIKNLETGLFAASCVLVLFGNAPIGDAIIPGSHSAVRWLMDVPTMAGMRAITIGLGLGIIAYGLRVMLGYERAVIGEVTLKEE